VDWSAACGGCRSAAKGGAGVGGGGGEGRGFLLFGIFVLVFVSLISAEWRRSECRRSKKRGRREVGIAEKVRKGRAVGRVADVELVLSLPTVTAPAYV
jgi:hypothetical protein